MSNSFNLGGDQIATIEFSRDPCADDFKKLIAVLELQRALIAGDPIEFEITVSAKPKFDSEGALACALCGEGRLHWRHDIGSYPGRPGETHQFALDLDDESYRRRKNAEAEALGVERCSRCNRPATHSIHREKGGHPFNQHNAFCNCAECINQETKS